MKYNPTDTRNCPNFKNHTEGPIGYNAWQDWASRKYNQGCRQLKCPGCGLYSIWTEKKKFKKTKLIKQ